jgi:hypothetical protein
MTPAQCRAARALTFMTQSQLALAAVVPRNVVVDFEVSSLTPKPAYLEAIREALKRAGVEFTNGGQPGVRLKAGRQTPSSSEVDPAPGGFHTQVTEPRSGRR